MANYRIHTFPTSRLATIDVLETGKRKHHIAGMIELDVTESRKKLRKYKREIHPVSFTAWLVKVISYTVKEFEMVASYRKGKRKAIVFEDINVSIVVEKELAGQKVPIPLVIEKANEASLESITDLINEARNRTLTEQDVVLQRKADRLERLYYLLPGFARRMFWKYMLKHPLLAFRKMGNVALTSVGTIGNVKGWFIPTSVHPVCFGINNISKKPVVVDDRIEIREVLNMTILLDHDVMDGAPMARFAGKLTQNIEKGWGLVKDQASV